MRIGAHNPGFTESFSGFGIAAAVLYLERLVSIFHRFISGAAPASETEMLFVGFVATPLALLAIVAVGTAAIKASCATIITGAVVSVAVAAMMGLVAIRPLVWLGNIFAML